MPAQTDSYQKSSISCIQGPAQVPSPHQIVSSNRGVNGIANVSSCSSALTLLSSCSQPLHSKQKYGWLTPATYLLQRIPFLQFGKHFLTTSSRHPPTCKILLPLQSKLEHSLSQSALHFHQHSSLLVELSLDINSSRHPSEQILPCLPFKLNKDFKTAIAFQVLLAFESFTLLWWQWPITPSQLFGNWCYETGWLQVLKKSSDIYIN